MGYRLSCVYFSGHRLQNLRNVRLHRISTLPRCSFQQEHKHLNWNRNIQGIPAVKVNNVGSETVSGTNEVLTCYKEMSMLGHLPC